LIIGLAIKVHRILGPGLLESIYEEALVYELQKVCSDVERQKEILIIYDGITLGNGFKADIIVNKTIIIELKSVEKVLPVHFKQLQTYLKLTNLKLGLLINFNEVILKNGIKRIANNLPEQ